MSLRPDRPFFQLALLELNFSKPCVTVQLAAAMPKMCAPDPMRVKFLKVALACLNVVSWGTGKLPTPHTLAGCLRPHPLDERFPFQESRGVVQSFWPFS